MSGNPSPTDEAIPYGRCRILDPKHRLHQSIPLLLAGISHASHLQAISASPTVHTLLPLLPLLHPPVWTSIPNGNSPRFLQKQTPRMV